MKSTQNHSDSKINSSLLADQKVSKEGAMISEYLFGRIRELSDKGLTQSEIAERLVKSIVERRFKTLEKRIKPLEKKIDKIS